MPLLLDRRGLLVLGGAAGLASSLPLPATAGPEVGKVAVLLGNALRHSAGSPIALQPGGGVIEGDEVETEAESRMAMAFVDGSVLTLGPQTRVQIRQYAPDGEAAQALILLTSGILKVSIGDGVVWKSFQVETETAIASVRATEWVMEQTAEGGSAVFVIEGRVEVTPRDVETPGPTPSPGPAPSDAPITQPSDAPVVLSPGEGTDVKPGAGPTAPKLWGAPRRDAALARVSLP